MARKRRHNSEHSGGHERWLVSYADFITLLFAFFVVMYAIAMKDRQKAREMAENIKQSLAAAGIGEWDGSRIRPKVEGTPNGQASPSAAASPPSLPSSAVEAEMQRLENVLGESLRYEVTQGADKQSIEIARDDRGVVVRMAASAFFDNGAAHAKKSALPVLDQISKLLNTVDLPIRIEGHTDSQPVDSAEFASNWELSSARATWVVRYMIEKHKIDPKRLVAAGYAEHHPLVPNTTSENRARNRRIEIVVHK